MQLSEKVIHYIKSTHIPESINSNVLISDLEKIIYTATFEQDKYYMSNPLSKEILSLIKDWNSLPISENLFFMENNSIKKVINSDKKEYAALVIFPIYIDNKIERSYNLF